ncbi:MAG: type II secretion system F family protein [Acidimicrobiia bacterium]
MRTRTRLTVAVVGATLAMSAAPVAAAEPVMAAQGAKSWLILLSAIAAALGTFLLLVVLFGGGRNTRDTGIAGRLGSYGSNGQKASGFFGRFGFMRRAAASADEMVAKRGNTTAVENALEQANIPIRPGEAVMAVFGIAIIVGLITGLATKSFVFAGVAGAVVVVFASLYVSHVASKQKKKFDMQLPDTLNLLSTSLRAGYSVMQAIEAAAQEAPEPTRREFGRAMTEIRLGRPLIDALNDIATRMESKDFEWAVIAIAIQREVGGNLAEVLQSTAETMMHRNRFRREVKALTAEGRISAWIMALMPVGVIVAIWVMNPDYIVPLWSTPIGLALSAGGVILMGAGIFWMMKIVSIDV